MALNSSGVISLGGPTLGQSIELELYNVGQGYASNGSVLISLDDSAVRTLANVASGTYGFRTVYGQAARAAVSYTFSANASNQSLNVSSLPGYVAGLTTLTITINPGIYVWSSCTATPALTLTGGTTGDSITIVNQGKIMGQGGAGGGNNGGPALSLGYPTTINNTYASAYIAGGGGGMDHDGGSSGTESPAPQPGRVPGNPGQEF